MNKINFTSNHKIYALALLVGSTLSIGADTLKLQQMATQFKQTESIQKKEVIEFAKLHKLPLRQKLTNGRIIEMQKIENGIPLYYTTFNEDAATSTRTNHLWSAPFDVTGSGYTKLGEWDEGAVRITHQELIGRVTQVDGASILSDHATHVAGTLIASGAELAAKGMAYQATLLAYDWNNDSSEMAIAASNGMEISNHSYGYVTGWDGSKDWYGDTSISQNEAYKFGFYSDAAQDWDNIAFNAPNYLIIKAAGNDRSDNAPPLNTEHTHNGSGSFFDTHNNDGFDNGGFDTIGDHGVAKNILTVGAVDDVPSYSSANDVDMSPFSGWGPTDDGRIKPDIVGNGINLYSPIGSSNTDYSGTYSGTSMASPNVTGTLALLQQYYQSTHSASIMRSATLKALVLHTADEAGIHTGPDYQFGWGLLNAQKAAEKILEDVNVTKNVIDELSLSNEGSYTRNIILTEDSTTPLKVTIVWTDPAGTPVAPALDPPNKMLVNDLDLRIVKDGATTYNPWKLDKANPSNAATNNSENNIDNVEQVYIDTPTAGTYRITVDHDGELTGGSQDFSIILTTSGSTTTTNIAPTANAGDDKSTPVNSSITITGTGTDTDGSIANYQWTEDGDILNTSSTSGTFTYTPTTVGDHTLVFTVTDNEGATGSDPMIVTATSSDDGESSSGGGSGCTYNPNNKSFDLMFIFMILLSLFYPLRRKYLS
jgi:hypothetical protein